MAGAFSLLFGLFFPWIFKKPIPLWPWIVAAVFLLPGLAAPMTLRWPFRVWMKIGHFLGAINSRILLGLVYAVLFTPFGLLMRLSGKDPMRRRYERQAATYRIPRAGQDPGPGMENPF